MIFNLVLSQLVGEIITACIHFKNIDSVFHKRMLIAYRGSSDPIGNFRAKN